MQGSRGTVLDLGQVNVSTFILHPPLPVFSHHKRLDTVVHQEESRTGVGSDNESEEFQGAVA